MIHGNSAWKEFFRDFVDALGGIGVGYAIATSSITYGTIGTTLILISIYLRFYKRRE